jgi:hypothetical protein
VRACVRACVHTQDWEHCEASRHAREQTNEPRHELFEVPGGERLGPALNHVAKHIKVGSHSSPRLFENTTTCHD